MHEFKSRSEKNFEAIETFLTSQEQSREMILYAREMATLQKQFPQIIIEKGNRFLEGRNLYICEVRKIL